MKYFLCYNLNMKNFYVVYVVDNIKYFFTEDYMDSNLKMRVDIYVKVNELNNNDENGFFLFMPYPSIKKYPKTYDQISDKNKFDVNNIKLMRYSEFYLDKFKLTK